MFLPQRVDYYADALTASERTLAAAVCRRYPEGLLDSVSQIAATAETSAATVVRFFAKLGYASIADARREARAQLTTPLPEPSQRSDFTIARERSMAECLTDTLLHDQHNLQGTFAALDVDAFEAVVRTISSSAGQVYVMAGENSAPVAAHLAAHLNICRPGVLDLNTRAPFLVDRMLWIKPGDVLLAYSIRRYANSTLQTARHFHEQGATVLAIADSMSAPLVRYAQHCLLVQSANASPFDSYTATFSLCNAIVSAVAQLRKTEVAQSLQRRDQMWTRIQSETQAKPLRAKRARKSASSPS